MQGSLNLVCYFPRPKPSTLCKSCPWIMVWDRARGPKGMGHLCTLDTCLVFFLFH